MGNMLDAVGTFKRHFGFKPPQAVRVPLSVELLGSAASPAQGLFLGAALDLHVVMVAAPRMDGKINLVTPTTDQPERFSTSSIYKNLEAPWADAVKGVLIQRRKRGIGFGGFDAAIEYPTNAMGLEVSHAAALATMLILERMRPLPGDSPNSGQARRRVLSGEIPVAHKTEMLAMARFCETVEREYLGGGDVFPECATSLLGKAFHAVLVDCGEPTASWLPLIGEVALILSTARAAKSTDSSHARTVEWMRTQTEAVVSALGVRSLRTLDLPMLSAKRSRLKPGEYAWARHCVTENQLAVHAERALLDNDIVQFGQFMFQSHTDATAVFAAEDMDERVALARKHPACLGARRVPGALGWATIAYLVARPQTQEFREHLENGFKERTGLTLETRLCQIVDGIRHQTG